MASVSLSAVTKIYGRVAVVRRLDLDVAEGEFVVLLGPSGCGKTTTLRIVAGFAQPDEGQVLIGGEDVTYVPPRLRNIGMVFQDYALFPNMTVAGNIGFGLRERKVPKAQIEERVSELLALVQLSARSGAFVGELSGGQQQRVALARALAYRPRLLLMDEPLGALDLKLRESMQVELQRIHRTLGITTIMVTHDQREAMSLADRIVVMADGEIQQIGTPEDLYSQPRSMFVADFIGKNNLLDGHVIEAKNGHCKIRIAGEYDVESADRDGLCAGEVVAISVRPEQVQVLEGPRPGLNTVAGRIESRRFLGNVIYYLVRLPDRTLVLIESSASERPVHEGATVTVGWKPESGIVFRKSSFEQVACAHGLEQA